MRKLAIALCSIVLLFGAACASNSDKSDGWSASQKADLRHGLVQGYELSGLSPSVEMTDCMTDYIVSNYSHTDLTTMSSDDQVSVGTDTAVFCIKRGITS